nr:UvrD-helicase domain-containing protein [Nitrospirota bacterium]
MSHLNGTGSPSGNGTASISPALAPVALTPAATAAPRGLETLNPQQRVVALHGEGPLLVLAVAGSGKTRAIAHRAVSLISGHGVSPSHILCLTFTNKAAEEMRERVGQLLGGHRNGITIATYHALCARLLRAHHTLIKRSRRFVIYDNEDVARVGKEVAKELHAEGCSEPLLADIDRLKHRGVQPEEARGQRPQEESADRRYLELLHRAYQLYEKKLARYDALDFTDLLLKTLLMLEAHPTVLDQLRHRYRYILVDEYQDTCPLQERLLQRLAMPDHNLCVVGDDDQVIYAFRHADVSRMLTFESRYAGAKVIRMEENYRSSGSIIEVARRIIAANERRQPKTIYTANPRGNPVEVVGFPSEEQEAGWLAGKIQELLSQGIPSGELAVLCRVSSLFRPIERELTARLIPYVLVDGLAFWERREIKDVMAYLRFVHNSLDYLSFKRMANVPPRGIGKKTLSWIEERLKTEPAVSLGEILEAATVYCRPLRQLLAQIDTFRAHHGAVSRLIEMIVERIGYEAHLVKRYPDATKRMSHLAQLVSIARRFDHEQGAGSAEPGEGGLSEFLLQAGLSATGEDAEERGAGVRLMTIHAAKGLEFRGVFVVGLEDGILPHARCREQLEEERRLLYVAVTRARERLFLSWSTRRVIHGREMSHLLSPFVREFLPSGAGCRPSSMSHVNGKAVIYYHPFVEQGRKP